ncbi:MAG: TonB family protein [Nitrospinae bacterium]|jgi:periplasmic protein TonB|nr:TonB family protein [Nitrospinota bacterium]MDA1109744.1 TonB family protein [Nitrospinota bacterium]
MKSGSAINLADMGAIPSERFWLHKSLLNQTRLNRFVLYSLIIHIVFLLLYWLMPAPSPVTPPNPIHVKFVEPEKSKSELEKGTIIDAPEPKKIEKPKTSELRASHDSRAQSNIKNSPDKEYRRKKTAVPKSSGVPTADKKLPTPPQKKISRSIAKKKAVESKQSFPITERGIFVPLAQDEPQNESESSLNAGTKGALSLLDGFDPDKYASLDTKTENLEDSDSGEDVSLDTTETQYASYFTRIKHQIERVWTYPSEAAQRGISGRLTLRFRISKDGNLVSARVVDKSGHEILDFAAIKAVKEAAPFYPFPANIKKDQLSILATFIYSPTYGLLKN